MQLVKKRYAFFQVLWVVIAINLFFTLFGVFTTMVLKVPDETEAALKESFALRNIIKQLIGIVCQAIYYYYALNYFNKLIIERRSWKHYALALFINFAIIILYMIAMYKIFPAKAGMQYITTKVLVFSFSVSSVFLTGFTLLLAYLNNLRDEQKHRKILEAQKMQLEVDKTQAHFKFLKSQINPHFLHNTLNFLYAKSLPYSPELSEGILTLSDIMRYALNEDTSANGKTLLKDEIEHVRNVIKINQLRFSNNLHVNFEVHGVINGKQIIPFVLITMVENAFKHGDLQSVEHPINIRLEVDHNKLYFYCNNKKKTGPKEISTGLGLDNIRNRLDFTYGSKYKLAIKEDAQFYTTELTIEEL